MKGNIECESITLLGKMVDPFTWHFDGYEEENIAYKHTDQNILNLAHFDFGLNLERWAE